MNVGSTGPKLSGEMLYGTKAIAEFLGIKPRAAKHLVDQDRIPHFKIGRRICAAPSKLAAWLEEQHERAKAA